MLWRFEVTVFVMAFLCLSWSHGCTESLSWGIPPFESTAWQCLEEVHPDDSMRKLKPIFRVDQKRFKNSKYLKTLCMTFKNNDESGVLYTKQVARPFSSHDLLVDLTCTAPREICLQSSTVCQVKEHRPIGQVIHRHCAVKCEISNHWNHLDNPNIKHPIQTEALSTCSP